MSEYDLFEDIIAKLRFETLGREQQHEQLRRVKQGAVAALQAVIDDIRSSTEDGLRYDTLAKVLRAL